MSTNLPNADSATLPVRTDPSTYLAECRQRSAAEGSSLYYASLFVPAQRQPAWLGIVTMVRDIQIIPLKVQDSSLGAIKLAWWKGEFERTVNGNPGHPATRCIDRETARTIEPDSLARLVEAVSVSAQWPQYFTQADWDESCRDWGGEAFCMAARALGCDAGASDEQIRAFGAAAMRLTQLLMLAPAIGQGWHPFPVNLLQEAGVSAEALRRRDAGPELAALIGRIHANTLQSGEKAWRALPRPVRLLLRPLRALWRMRVAEMRLAQAEGYPLLTQRVRITPLKKLWLAWTSHALRR